MKCRTCGNEIPDGSIVCPYCNSNVTVLEQTPIDNSGVDNIVPIQGSILPQTPTKPVLPEDQGMVITPLAPAEPIEESAPIQMPNVVSQQSVGAPIQPEVVQQPVTTPVQPEVVQQPVITPVQPEVVQQPVITPVQPEVVQQPVITPIQPEVVQQPVATPVQPEVILPNANPLSDGVAVPIGMAGEKMASTAPVVNEKKKSKKGFIIGLFVAVILLALIGGGTFYYMTAYKTGDKRIDVLVDKLFFYTNGITNDNIELSSGSYKMSGTLSYNDKNDSISLNGKYGHEIANKIFDLTINADSIVVDEELLTEPLNVELYSYDSKGYLLLQNLYEKYIYTSVDKYDNLIDNASQNDINYNVMLMGIKNSLKVGLKSSGYVQTNGTVSISGVSKNANIVTLDLNNTTIKNIYTSMINSLTSNPVFVTEYAKLINKSDDDAKKVLTDSISKLNENTAKNVYTSIINFLTNNKSFITVYAKLNNKTVEEVKKELTDSISTVVFGDESAQINIYTDLLGKTFYGINISAKDGDDNYLVDITPYQTGYSILATLNGTKVCDSKFTLNNEVNSTTKTSTFVLDAILNVNNTAYTVNCQLEKVADINPKVEKVTVKNSIDYQYLTDDDKQIIKEKLYQFGKLGSYLKSLGLFEDEELTDELGNPIEQVDVVANETITESN